MQEQASIWLIIASVGTVLMGLGGVLRGWQMKYRNRLDLVSDWDNRPLPNPANFAQAFGNVYIGIGAVMIAMLLPLLLGLHLLIWTGIFYAIIWYWFRAIDVIAARARGKTI